MPNKKGVLLINLGTPDSPKVADVRRYLVQFLTDGRVIDIPWLQRNLLVRGIIVPFRARNSAKLYKQLWTNNGSPLKHYGERLEALLQEQLGSDYNVVLAMRYQQPSIEAGIERLYKARVSEIIVLPLFPQYASATTGSVHEAVMRALIKKQIIPKLTFINSYFDYQPMVELFAERARQFDIASYDHVLFSYHGLPERQLRKADDCNHCLRPNCCNVLSDKNQFCYSAQCHATTRALVAELGLQEGTYTSCFQSRLGKDPWIRPYTSDVLHDLAKQGAKRLLVFSPAFVADCLETTIEISEEYQQEFEALGGERVDLVPSLNDDPKWAEALRDMVLAI
jgi:ferrochelatase